MSSDLIVQIHATVRLTLGLIFLVSSVSKLRDLPEFVGNVANYQLVSIQVSKIIGYTLPFVEVAAAILLIANIALAVASFFVLILLVVFTVAISIGVLHGRTVSCHCFGSNNAYNVGWYSLSRDILLLPLVSWLLWIELFSPIDAARSVLFSPFSIGACMVIVLLYFIVVEGLDLVFAPRQPYKPVRG